MALSVVTTPSGTVRLISQNISKVTNVIQGNSLWENDGVDHVKPKGTKTVDAPYLELGGKVDVVSGKGLSTEDYTTAEQTKLAGLPEGTDLTTALGLKEDKVAGKGLSTNDFTDDAETKVGYLTGSGDGLLSLYNNGSYRKANKATGFTGEPVRTYDPVARTYTLTGAFKAYLDGQEVTAIVNGWVSSPHADVAGIYYLRYDGTFHFTTTPFDIETDLLIGYAYYNSSKFGMSECHGLDMSGATHKHLHSTVGAYKSSGGDFSGYTLASTTGIDRRPNISETTIYDEDLKTVLETLTTETYTRRFLSGANTREFAVDQTEIIPVLGAQPYYNFYTGGAWTQALMDNNNYAAIFVAALPTTSDSGSKKFRFVFVQPQTQSATLSTIQALSPSSLVLGDSTTLVAEFVFIGKIIIRYTSADWTITSVEKLEGTKISQVAIPVTSTPVASSIAFTPTGNIAASNVQSAIAELDTEKASTTALHDAVTITDSDSIDLALTGQALSATAKFGSTIGTICQGDDTRLSDARTPTAHNQAETTISFTDVTTNNASATKHGFLPKLDGLTTTYLRGDGAWGTPAGGGGVTDGDKGDIVVSGSGATWTLDDSFKTATAGSNGDFYITSAITLATNDIVRISFPAATNGASNARLSVDGGSNYKEIRMPIPSGVVSYNVLASAVQSSRKTFVYDGTYFQPLNEPNMYIPVAIAYAAPTTAVPSGFIRYYPYSRRLEFNFRAQTTSLTANTGYNLITFSTDYPTILPSVISAWNDSSAQANINCYVQTGSVRVITNTTSVSDMYVNGGCFI